MSVQLSNISEADRFSIDLEFIQNLANPAYLHCMECVTFNFCIFLFFFQNNTVLAQNGYFDDRRFLSYLEYLRYFKDPKYAKMIM